MPSSKIHILYENQEWFEPLSQTLAEAHVPHEGWDLSEGYLDLNKTPPQGIFYSKMSASAHTRGHHHATDLAAAAFAWLETHGRRVINGSAVLNLELRKTAQYLALQKAGLRIPKTVAAQGKAAIAKTAKHFSFPFILKPNRGGKGIGVKLIYSQEELDHFLANTDLSEFTIDGLVLLQEYIQSPDQTITRMEFIGGKFYYAVRVDTGGGFELCPADGCTIEGLACPVEGQEEADAPRFTIIENFNIPELETCESFLAQNQVEVAGIEFISNEKGERFFYDVNTNTNYNTIAEREAGWKYSGMKRMCEFLKSELERNSGARGIVIDP